MLNHLLNMIPLAVMNVGAQIRSSEGYDIGASKLENEEIGWTICNSYPDPTLPPGQGIKWCCCPDLKECLITRDLCVSFCSQRHRLC